MRKRSSRTSVRYGQPEPLDFRQRSFRRHRPFGYALTLRPFLKVGIAFGAAAGLAFAADTLSITVMEIVDNAILLLIPGAMDAGLADLLFWAAWPSRWRWPLWPLSGQPLADRSRLRPCRRPPPPPRAPKGGRSRNAQCQTLHTHRGYETLRSDIPPSGIGDVMGIAAERIYVVDGMTCGHCSATITEEVQRVPGVSGVEVDLDGGTVTVRGADTDDAAIRAAIDEAGYQVRP
jgi:copper chaperone CopZ